VAEGLIGGKGSAMYRFTTTLTGITFDQALTPCNVIVREEAPEPIVVSLAENGAPVRPV
jgi:hypothetical protein